MSDDFSVVAETVVVFAEKMKRVMLSKGLRRARARCPRHSGRDSYVHASLHGPKNHIHLACEEPHCIMRMIE